MVVKGTMPFRGFLKGLRLAGFVSTEIVKDVLPFFDLVDLVKNNLKQLQKELNLTKEEAKLVLPNILEIVFESSRFEELFDGKYLEKELKEEFEHLTIELLEKLIDIDERFQKVLCAENYSEISEEFFEKLKKVGTELEKSTKLQQKEIEGLFYLLMKSNQRFTKVAKKLKERRLDDYEVLEVIAMLLDDVLYNNN